MPIMPNFVERLILLKLNLGPGAMLDILGAGAFLTISAALKLGVFETLSGGPLTTEEIARRIRADERGTTLMLEAVEALGYVKKRKGHYANTAMTAKWLVRSSPNCIADGFSSAQGLFERWGYLEESIRRGKPSMLTWEWLDQDAGRWKEYQQGMIAMARMAADELVSKVKLAPTARRLLDVGGGHGLYSIKFCRRYPQLSATVFDLPQALEVAREMIDAEKMSNRVTVKEGDFWTDDLGTGYDVALLFNIIHGFSPEKNTLLFQKVAGVLDTGGQIMIMDQLAGKVTGPTAKAVTSLQGLNLFNEVGGQTYTSDEITRWLIAAGFTRPRRINLRKAPGFGLMLGIKTD